MYPVHFQKRQHNVHADALVAVHKSVVGDERIAEPCALFLLGRIELLSVKAGKGVLGAIFADNKFTTLILVIFMVIAMVIGRL